jgi:hypothetical protein
MLFRLGLGLVLAAGTSGCVSGAGGDAPRRPPTLVGVSVKDFQGAVPCVDVPGALRSYVVRLFDHGTEEQPQNFELPASVVDVQATGVYRPVRCEDTAVFGHVVPGHRYSAIVEAYDATNLVAQGPGSPLLEDPVTGQYVAPRWTTRCGRDADGNPINGAVTAAQFVTRFVRGCEPLSVDGAGETALTVGLDGLGACGTEPGEIERFSVRMAADPLSKQEAACGDRVAFSNLTAGASYFFELLAFESWELFPTWGTSCFRTALAGVTLAAACDELGSRGALEISQQKLLSTWGASCGTATAGIATLRATLSPPGTEQQILSCGAGPVRFGDLEPGVYQVDIASERGDGSPGPAAICDATVEPGLVTQAKCADISGGM